MCLDFDNDQDVLIGQYQDNYQPFAKQFFYYRFQYCGEEEQPEISCLGVDERDQWLDQHEIEIYWYQVQTWIDYSQQDYENVLV